MDSSPAQMILDSPMTVTALMALAIRECFSFLRGRREDKQCDQVNDAIIKIAENTGVVTEALRGLQNQLEQDRSLYLSLHYETHQKVDRALRQPPHNGAVQKS